MTIAARLAAQLMRLAPAEPPTTDDPRFSQIFRHDEYVSGSEETRRERRRGSSAYRYEYESKDGMFAKFFPDFDLSQLKGSVFLDLGCLTGGRTAAWQDAVQPAVAHGFDIEHDFVLAAKEFADSRNDASHFAVSLGEQMPYRDESFDAIATFDVLEHVQDIEAVLAEAFRVLKPGGRLLAVFPTRYNPLASHLNLATRVHGLNVLFPGKALAQAHHDVIAERGAEHEWYNDSPELPDFYVLPFLNGITVKRFRAIIDASQWQVEQWPKKPIFTVGQRMQTAPFQLLSKVIRPLAGAPVLEEFFLTSISVVLQKPA